VNFLCELLDDAGMRLMTMNASPMFARRAAAVAVAGEAVRP
jgi:hypothetical protein